MKLYEVILEANTLGKDYFLKPTGEHFTDVRAFKNHASENLDKYNGKIYELHHEQVVRIKCAIKKELYFPEMTSSGSDATETDQPDKESVSDNSKESETVSPGGERPANPFKKEN